MKRAEEHYIKKVEYKQNDINYIKLGLSVLVSYLVGVILIARDIFDWYLITLYTFVFLIILGWFYYFFIIDRKIYFVKDGKKGQEKEK